MLNQKKSFAANKKAFADFTIEDKIEAGVKLLGPEVASVRQGSVNLKGGFIDIRGAEVWLKNVHIGPYKYATQMQIDPLRRRKLLLKKSEIVKLATAMQSKGLIAIPLEFYAKKHLIKLLIGLGKKKKKYDRREELKKKSQLLEVKRSLKRF